MDTVETEGNAEPARSVMSGLTERINYAKEMLQKARERRALTSQQLDRAIALRRRSEEVEAALAKDFERPFLEKKHLAEELTGSRPRTRPHPANPQDHEAEAKERERLWADISRVMELPNPAVDAYRAPAEELVNAAKDLFDEVTAGESLKAAGIEATKIEKKEFTDARNHHRDQQRYFAYALALVALIGAGLLGVSAWHLPTVVEGQDRWMPLLLHLGSRLSALVAIGWLASFLGRMQSRHAHQAVLYQNKLVAVDTADYIIRVASGPTRERLLADMVTALLSNERSAFVSDPVPRGRIPFDELRKTVDTFSAAVRPPSVAVRADST